MKLTYIYHSGFSIETADCTLIIDYYQDAAGDKQASLVSKLVDRPQKLYVLVSHGHADHFNPEILKWREKHPEITYIFSKDIENSLPKNLPGVIFIDKDGQYKDETIQVDAFGSTDLGVSFKIQADGKVIFHAGDLNNWHWNEESTDEEIRVAEDFYQRELDHVVKSTPYLDIAMFPVDPRLGKDYMKGANQFLERIPVKWFAPMHFGIAYDKAAAIQSVTDKFGAKLFIPTRRGDSITI